MLGENDGKEKSYSDTQDNDKKSRLHQHQLDHFFRLFVHFYHLFKYEQEIIATWIYIILWYFSGKQLWQQTSEKNKPRLRNCGRHGRFWWTFWNDDFNDANNK